MKKLLKVLVFSSVLVAGLFLATCANIPNVDPAAVYNQFFGTSGLPDADSDGLTDDEEIYVYLTNPYDADTDGDSFSDYEEIFDYLFDPARQPARFNPRLADLPQFRTKIISGPLVVLELTDTSGNTTSIETGSTEETATTTSYSSTESHTSKTEVHVGVEIETKASIFGPSGGATWSVDFTQGYEYTASTTTESSTENRTTLSRLEAVEQSHDIAASGGIIKVAVEVENAGNYSYRVENMVLSAYIPDFTWGMENFSFFPVGNLVLDISQSFPKFTLAPGQSIGPLIFIEDDLDLETAKTLLKNGKALSIKPVIAELTDAAEVPLAFNMTFVQSKTAKISIDYGLVYSGGVMVDTLPPETYYVATKGGADPDTPGITAAEAADLIGIDITEEMVWGGQTKTGVASIRGIGPDEAAMGHWLVIHTYPVGYGFESFFYEILEQDYSLEDIVLLPGDQLSFMYISDDDNDGYFGRTEFLMGTNPVNTDSDGDTISDNQEIMAGLDPSTNDSDWDGLKDDIDPDPKYPNFYNISAGTDFSLMVNTNGTMYSWGKNNLYQLGLSDTATKYEPTSHIDGDWALIAAGDTHSAAIKFDGALFTWGTGYDGELGQGSSTGSLPNPTRVGEDSDWIQVSAGYRQTHALKYNRTHWAYGNNDNGKSGVVINQSDILAPSLAYTYYDRFLQTTSGYDIHLAIKTDGTLWGAGQDQYCELAGNGTTGINNPPEQIGKDTDWLRAVAGGGDIGHALAIKTDGSLWAWGRNNYGSLGVGAVDFSYCTPVPVSTGPWLAVSNGSGEHTLGIKIDGSLWAWGKNDLCQLGLGHCFSPVISPRRVGFDNDWVKVSAGLTHSLAIKRDGTVWAWGKDVDGQVGDGNTDQNPKSIPVCVASVLPGGTCPPAPTPPWTWIKGSDQTGGTQVTGTLGVPAAANIPNSRQRPATWTDGNDNFWIYGGWNRNSCYFNDLWVYDRQHAGGQWAIVDTWSGGATCDAPGRWVNTDPNYYPGSRLEPLSWGPDANGDFWLFGGIYHNWEISSWYATMKDMWKFRPTWDGSKWDVTWTNVCCSTDFNANVGKDSKYTVPQYPGGRRLAATWMDSSGNLWLFGGAKYEGNLDDNQLWKYNIAGNTWTFMKGSQSSNQKGVYGTKGVPDVNNTPGARYGSAYWKDSDGNFWLFGGYGFDAYGSFGLLNDMWKYNVADNTWTWQSGGYTISNVGYYYNPFGYPGARYKAAAWQNSDGNFLLQGGYGYNDKTSPGFLNDLWLFDPTVDTNGDTEPEGEWSWIGGTPYINQYGIYGTLGTPGFGNKPGGREDAVSFVDSTGDAWIFGGYGYAKSTGTGMLNDLWRYEP